MWAHDLIFSEKNTFQPIIRRRQETVDRMKEALAKFVVSDSHTMIPFYQFMLKHLDHLSSKLNLRWVEDVCLKSMPSRVNLDKMMTRPYYYG